MWIWQHQQWPNFTWKEEAIVELLRKTRLKQGVFLGKIGAQGEDTQSKMLDTLLANIVHSSAIEGEKLNAFSVRSSLARRLGVSESNPFPTTEQTDGLAEIMIDAVSNYNVELTSERILYWHEKLFPEGASLLSNIEGGKWRGEDVMQVVSGRIDRPTVHFEAPPENRLHSEVEQFVRWFNHSRTQLTLDPLIRAALVHLRFVTIHPLDDGNGRITRLLTDLALAQAEQQSVRFYAMSVAILNDRKGYYQILEQTQKGDMDVTEWIVWFLSTLNHTFDDVLRDIDRFSFKTHYWNRFDQTRLTTEQKKVINRMLDGDFAAGINASQYQKVAKISKPTATRHLSRLVELGCLVKTAAGGRSTRYVLSRKDDEV
ncbi:Fic family protein [Vibrio viridaestus]|uniref:Fic family protein n=1 Tax=Vibrio viridaestus TaxID=2487322 RepID=A0A3N9U601_9VIBR|nr:Fic family protein [Vibrio viridaestus]RQW65162.1 Fic family protein [Vibrio viridaestus]